MLYETERIEFKEILTDDIYKCKFRNYKSIVLEQIAPPKWSELSHVSAAD